MERVSVIRLQLEHWKKWEMVVGSPAILIERYHFIAT